MYPRKQSPPWLNTNWIFHITIRRSKNSILTLRCSTTRRGRKDIELIIKNITENKISTQMLPAWSILNLLKQSKLRPHSRKWNTFKEPIMLVILMRLHIVIVRRVDTFQDRQWTALNPRYTMFSSLFDDKKHSLRLLLGISELPASLLLRLKPLSKTRVTWIQALRYCDSRSDNSGGD